MLSSSIEYIPHIIQQHAEESAILHNIRLQQVAAPHVKLHHLRRIDDRIVAHLDGLTVAGSYGSSVCEAALESAGVGEVFAAAIRAIEENDLQWLDRLFALAIAVPDRDVAHEDHESQQSAQPVQRCIAPARILIEPDPAAHRMRDQQCQSEAGSG